MAKLKRKPAVFKRARQLSFRLDQTNTAAHAIGQIEPGQSLFILTFGQMALMDILLAVLDQSGPASVDLSTWTISDSNIEQLEELASEGRITNLRIALDCSFPARQPACDIMIRTAFGNDAIRVIETHAKFLVIRSATLNVVVHASMNMNRNPRLENLELCEDEAFAAFFTSIVDDIFSEAAPEQRRTGKFAFDSVAQTQMFQEVAANRIPRSALNEPQATHTLRKL